VGLSAVGRKVYRFKYTGSKDQFIRTGPKQLPDPRAVTVFNNLCYDYFGWWINCNFIAVQTDEKTDIHFPNN